MAEFKDVMKKYKEMCKYYEGSCMECPIEKLKNKYNDACCGILENYPEEAEETIMAWEKPVDWSKVKVDTPIFVRFFEKDTWSRRHFANFKDGKVYAWADGLTSFTVLKDTCKTAWTYAKLAEGSEENG